MIREGNWRQVFHLGHLAKHWRLSMLVIYQGWGNDDFRRGPGCSRIACAYCVHRALSRSHALVTLEETTEDVYNTSSSAQQKWILTVWKGRAVAIPIIVCKVHVSGHCIKWSLRVVECNVKGGLRIENAGQRVLQRCGWLKHDQTLLMTWLFQIT